MLPEFGLSQAVDTSGAVVAVLVLLMLVAPAALVMVVPLVAGGAPVPDDAHRLRAVARTTTRWRWAGLAAGVAGLVVAAQTGSLGRGAMLAGPVLALGVLLGVVVGELRVAPQRGEVRSAVLETRRVRDYVPRATSWAVAAAVVVGAGLLTATTVTGSADDLGRAGRSLAYRCSDTLSGAAGPWPGSFYSLPLAAVVLGGLAATALALRAVTLRPRQGEDPWVDDALRRHAARAVVAAAGLLVAVPLAGVAAVTALTMNTAWQNTADCPFGAAGTLAVPLVVAALVVALLALALGGWCVATLLRPVRVPAQRAAGTVPVR